MQAEFRKLDIPCGQRSKVPKVSLDGRMSANTVHGSRGISRVLYIKVSPPGERSHSNAVADAFVQAYKDHHPGRRNSCAGSLKTEPPSFDGHTIDAKYVVIHGGKHTQEQLDAWRAVETIIDRFKSAGKYVLSTPMGNFGIPYKLKLDVDVLVRPGYTFTYSPEERHKSLVLGKPIVVVYARGGEYPPGSDFESYDLQSKYVELILRFIGFTDIRPLIVEPTLMNPALAGQRRDKLIGRVAELAAAL
jgi:FMN-dependent NADH-azoreductase